MLSICTGWNSGLSGDGADAEGAKGSSAAGTDTKDPNSEPADEFRWCVFGRVSATRSGLEKGIGDALGVGGENRVAKRSSWALLASLWEFEERGICGGMDIGGGISKSLSAIYCYGHGCNTAPDSSQDGRKSLCIPMFRRMKQSLGTCDVRLIENNIFMRSFSDRFAECRCFRML